MFLQRACDAENQAENKSSNGPLRAQSKAARLSILRRVGIRQLPGICWYSVESRDQTLKQGGTAELKSVLDKSYCHGRIIFF